MQPRSRLSAADGMRAEIRFVSEPNRATCGDTDFSRFSANLEPLGTPAEFTGKRLLKSGCIMYTRWAYVRPLQAAFNRNSSDKKPARKGSLAPVLYGPLSRLKWRSQLHRQPESTTGLRVFHFGRHYDARRDHGHLRPQSVQQGLSRAREVEPALKPGACAETQSPGGLHCNV